MGTLINPRQPTQQASQDFLPEPIYLRNPETGIIFKLTHIDTIKRCQQQFFQPSSEEAMLAQSAEMYDLQGRSYPPKSPTPTPSAPVAADAPAAETEEANDEPVVLSVHERNRRAALQQSRRR